MEKPANEMETICFVRSSGFPTGQPLYKLFNMLMYNVNVLYYVSRIYWGSSICKKQNICCDKKNSCCINRFLEMANNFVLRKFSSIRQ